MRFLEDRSHILRAFNLDVLVHFITHLRIDDVKRFQWTPCFFVCFVLGRGPNSFIAMEAQGTLSVRHNLG